MKRLFGTVLVAGIAAIVASGCCHPCCDAPSQKVKHVVVIGSDGFGAHYTDWAELPNLRALKERGAWTVKNRAVLPSSSAVNWAAHMMGVGTELHGYATWSSKKPDFPARELGPNGIPSTMFTLLQAQRPECKSGVIHNWEGIQYVIDDKAVGFRKKAKDDQIAGLAVEYWQKEQPTLAFFVFDEPDAVGHATGWGSKDYQAMLKTVDERVGAIIKGIADAGKLDETVILFISDHGGIANKEGKGTHGGKDIREMETPFIIAGPGVIPGEIQESMSHYDTASTVAWLLGLEQPQVWIGRPVPMMKHYKK